MNSNQLQIDEVNQFLHAVEERIESLMLDLQMLDEFKNGHTYRALEAQIQALEDQRRILSQRWSALTQGYADNS